MDIKSTLFDLSKAVGIGNITEARDAAYNILQNYAKCRKTDTLTLIGEIKGERDYTIMLDAHIDEVGFIVTSIDDEGFVTLSKCGGIDLRALSARRVTIHGSKKVTAVFCSTPPHLSSGEIEYKDILDLKLDTLLGKKAKEVIGVGDFVSFDVTPQQLLGTVVTGKSFDDRSGVVCLLKIAEYFSKNKPPCNIVFLLSDAEELGTRGAKTATFEINPDEAIAIDVSFSNAPDVSPEECGKLGDGAMIGISPVLDKNISSKLVNIAKKKNIPYQCEVMGGRTGTNGDAISITRKGVKTGVVSIPLRNMHTDSEVVDLRDIESVCKLLQEYILAGGVTND